MIYVIFIVTEITLKLLSFYLTANYSWHRLQPLAFPALESGGFLVEKDIVMAAWALLIVGWVLIWQDHPVWGGCASRCLPCCNG
ncbi:DUF417 family protein [Serratia marcescens]|uniref:DUF417 family protein n=1 Tax=Serratia marcescens TaxID=615 RepID=UPI003AFAEC16